MHPNDPTLLLVVVAPVLGVALGGVAGIVVVAYDDVSDTVVLLVLMIFDPGVFHADADDDTDTDELYSYVQKRTGSIINWCIC